MRMRSVLAVAVAAVLGAGMARAQEEISVVGQKDPIKTGIKSESPKGIVTTGKDTIPAEKILDVNYDLPEASVRINLYRPAQKAEKASLDPAAKDADRKAAIVDAIKKYDETAAKVTGADPHSKSARRHLEYKVAMLKLRQVLEDGAAPEAALLKLKEFKSRHPSSWQIVRVLESLGRLEMSQGDFKGAEETFKDLAGLDLTPEAKLDAQLLAVQAVIQDGRHAAALKTLQGMQVSEPALAARVKVAEAQCLVAMKQPDKAQQATKVLKQLLKDSSDKQVKAAAHNALGIMLFEKGDFKDARWEFLWVDVVYNQDKDEHAKALFYLWKTFEGLNDAVRAQECREALLSSQFSGLEFQRQAQKAAKAP